jgi:hypothetical protein
LGLAPEPVTFSVCFASSTVSIRVRFSYVIGGISYAFPFDDLAAENWTKGVALNYPENEKLQLKACKPLDLSFLTANQNFMLFIYVTY